MYFKDTVTTIDITTPKRESVSIFTKNSKEPGNCIVWSLSLKRPANGEKNLILDIIMKYHNFFLYWFPRDKESTMMSLLIKLIGSFRDELP